MALLCAIGLAMPAMLPAQPSHNVLFLIVDDLRPELPAYGRTQVHAPSMERIARTAMKPSILQVTPPIATRLRQCIWN